VAYRGFFTPSNPDKWVRTKSGLGRKDDDGLCKIEYRSGLERRFMAYCDTKPSILKVASEPFPIPYISPLDGKQHRYFIDFLIEMVNKNGNTVKRLIEIKPYKETHAPVKKNQKRGKFLNECATWARNCAKWDAAIAFGKKHNMEFQILDEYDLNAKPIPKHGRKT